MKQKDEKRIRNFINRINFMKVEAFNLGLLRTGHKLDGAIKEVGYEFADILTGKQVNLLEKHE